MVRTKTRPSKQPLMVRTFLKVYMELGSYFVLQEQIKDIIIIGDATGYLFLDVGTSGVDGAAMNPLGILSRG